MSRLKAFLLVVVIAVISFVIITASGVKAINEAWPPVNTSTMPNPTSIAEIKTLVERYFDITGQAARDFDISKFDTVFVDEPLVSLSSEQQEFMARVGAKGSGMSSLFLAFYGNWKQGAEKFEQLVAERKAQGRTVTAEDFNAISHPGGTPPPARRTDPMYKVKLTFNSFIGDDTQALVEFDSGSATHLMFMVNTKDGWRIAGLRYLKVHF